MSDSPFGEQLIAYLADPQTSVQRFENEVALNCALNQHFEGRARNYPSGNKRRICDVVLPVSEGKFRWIEVKYAQTYFSQQRVGRDNRSLLEKHVFGSNPQSHTVRNDVLRKLELILEHREVAHIGMLVVFLYSDRFPLPEEMWSRLRVFLPEPAWQRFERKWRNPDHPDKDGERTWVHPVYWERSAG